MVVRAGGMIVYRIMQSQIEYLLLQTSYGEHHWSPPKGHVDPGEDERTAAVRETEEEAGLASKDLTVEAFSTQLNYVAHGKNKSVVYWLAKLNDVVTPVKLSHEHQDFKWLPLEQACDTAKYEDMVKALRDSEQFLKQKAQL